MVRFYLFLIGLAFIFGATDDVNAGAGSKKLEARNFKAVTIDQKNHAVKLSWRGPKSAKPLRSFQIYRNQVKIGQTTRRSFVDRKALSGNLNYKIVVVYESGEVVPTSQSVQVKMPFRGFTR